MNHTIFAAMFYFSSNSCMVWLQFQATVGVPLGCVIRTIHCSSRLQKPVG